LRRLGSASALNSRSGSFIQGSDTDRIIGK
jgi:hypothetical protein